MYVERGLALLPYHCRPFLADNLKLFGAFFCARAAARAFMKQGVKGSIVFTASMASYRPNKVRFLIALLKTSWY